MATPTTKNAPAAKNAPTAAKPGDPAPKAKKEKVVRIPHPAIKADAQGKGTVKLEDFPADYDPKIHKQLRKADFVNEAPFLERRAAQLEKAAANLRAEAAQARTLGSTADRQKAKKLKSMIDKVAELRKEFEAQGLDVDALVGQLGAKQTATEPANA